MADYIAEAMRTRTMPGNAPGTAIDKEIDAVYVFALYLAKTFSERFDRARFDAHIKAHSKV